MVTPEITKKIFDELQGKAATDEKWKKLLDFYNEQVFRYHLFDTTPHLINQWKEKVSEIFD
jgi:hypothetical protein